MAVVIRRLGDEDDDVVSALATYPGLQARSEFLTDPRTILLVAFDDVRPVGFVLAHELLRRHGDHSMLLVYEVEVDEAHRRRGIARQLFEQLRELAAERGIRDAWVLTEPDNDAANALYASLGGSRSEVVMWDFTYGDR